jgi:hypothetical protein
MITRRECLFEKLATLDDVTFCSLRAFVTIKDRYGSRALVF